MSNYTQIVDFSAKDSLTSGDPNKVIKGSEQDAELDAISTAIASKADDSAVVHDTGTETVDGNKTFTGANTQSGAYTISGAATLSSTVAVASDISPSQITSDQNDYNPTSLSTSSVLRLTSDAVDWDITGLQGGADGRVITLLNVGSFYIRIADESGSSTAAYRFALSGDILLLPDTALTLWYDSTSSRWRVRHSPDEALGVRQTWQDMTGVGGRALAANIRNTSGKPIQVNVSSSRINSAVATAYFRAYCDTTATPAIKVAGFAAVGQAGVTDAVISEGTVSFVVPNNSYYRIDANTYAIDVWAELR